MRQEGLLSSAEHTLSAGPAVTVMAEVSEASVGPGVRAPGTFIWASHLCQVALAPLGSLASFSFLKLCLLRNGA